MKNKKLKQEPNEQWFLENESFLSSIEPMTAEEREMYKNPLPRGFSVRFKTELDRAMFYGKRRGLSEEEIIKSHKQGVDNLSSYGKKLLCKENFFQRKTQKKIVQLMPILEAKKKFWENNLKDSVFPEKYIVDAENSAVIEQLLKYFILDPTCKFSLRKGIFLMGGYGTGKTNLMTQFSKFTMEQGLSTSFQVERFSKIAANVVKDGAISIGEYSSSNFCFDEMIMSEKNRKSWGNKVAPLEDLINERYVRFTKQTSAPTHFTSNVDFFAQASSQDYASLKSNYEEGVLDRLRQMATPVYLGGSSRRK